MEKRTLPAPASQRQQIEGEKSDVLSLGLDYAPLQATVSNVIASCPNVAAACETCVQKHHKSDSDRKSENLAGIWLRIRLTRDRQTSRQHPAIRHRPGGRTIRYGPRISGSSHPAPRKARQGRA